MARRKQSWSGGLQSTIDGLLLLQLWTRTMESSVRLRLIQDLDDKVPGSAMKQALYGDT